MSFRGKAKENQARKSVREGCRISFCIPRSEYLQLHSTTTPVAEFSRHPHQLSMTLDNAQSRLGCFAAHPLRIIVVVPVVLHTSVPSCRHVGLLHSQNVRVSKEHEMRNTPLEHHGDI